MSPQKECVFFWTPNSKASFSEQGESGLHNRRDDFQSEEDKCCDLGDFGFIPMFIPYDFLDNLEQVI